MPPWLLSLYLHAILLATLAFITFAGAEPHRDSLLVLLDASQPHVDAQPEIEIEPLPEFDDLSLEPDVGAVASELLDAPLEKLDSSGFDLFANQANVSQPIVGEFSAIAGMFDGRTAVASENRNRPGDSEFATFFGTAIEGKRIVFVLDNSGSMQGGRLETVIAELLRCVDALADDQRFYVVFHSDALYPLFYPDPLDRFILPDQRNKMLLREWLATVELCLGDSVDEAIAAAASISPDTVFLLSDGQIPSAQKRRFLLDGQSRPFVIHTFGVGLGGSDARRRILREIAAANGGQFRESPVPPAMRRLADENPRPYHRDSPGLVWGRNVGAARR